MTVVIAGSSGLVGSAVERKFREEGHTVVGINKSVVDLLDKVATEQFVRDVSPSILIDAAARVGGIVANDSFPVDFLTENLMIQTNLLRASHIAKVHKVVFLGSSCIYPRDSAQPIKEEYLMTGGLEKTNSAYAIAKIAGIELINSYRKQYDKKWISLMPTNLYGPNDNFNLETSHVVPALIRKFLDAADSKLKELTLWGDGSPRREFLYVDDLADAVYFAAKHYDSSLHLNVGTGEDISIAELANKIMQLTGYTGRIRWDVSKPNGTPRKVLDISRIRSLGWEPKTSLDLGLDETISWYRDSSSKGLVRL
jgi:GDP-L-fucose synthase